MLWNILMLLFAWLLSVSLIVARPPNILVVLFGEYRTFSAVCTMMMENVVNPNAMGGNVYLVLVVDENKPFQLDFMGSNCLHPYADRITILDGKRQIKDRHRWVTEFVLIKEAFDYVEKHPKAFPKFDYAIKIRFDLACKYPLLPLMELYHPKEGSISYQRFVKQHYSIGGREKEIAYNWIRSAGNVALFNNTIHSQPIHRWTLYNQTYVLRGVKGFIDSSHESNAVKLIDSIYAKYPIAYVIGNTWLHFGPYDTIRDTSFRMEKTFGTLRNDLTSLNKDVNLAQRMQPLYENVTEIVFRYAHYSNNITLVDIHNPFDWALSLDHVRVRKNSSFAEDMRNERLMFFIARDCQRAPNQVHCTVNQAARRRDRPGPGKPHNPNSS